MISCFNKKITHLQACPEFALFARSTMFDCCLWSRRIQYHVLHCLLIIIRATLALYAALFRQHVTIRMPSARFATHVSVRRSHGQLQLPAQTIHQHQIGYNLRVSRFRAMLHQPQHSCSHCMASVYVPERIRSSIHIGQECLRNPPWLAVRIRYHRVQLAWLNISDIGE
jgi:hypothetical protein